MLPDGSHPAEFWQTWTIKLGFVIIFEVLVFARVMSLCCAFLCAYLTTLFLLLQHLLFILAGVLDMLVPDLPKSVQEEIRREKLLAARIINRDKPESKAHSKSDSDTARPITTI